MTDEQILERLVALNGERAAEEQRGLIHWLRPELQNPAGTKTATQEELATTDLPEEDVEASKARQGRVQNAVTEVSVELRGLKEQHGEILRELASLHARRSNIPSRMLEIRAALCKGVMTK